MNGLRGVDEIGRRARSPRGVALAMFLALSCGCGTVREVAPTPPRSAAQTALRLFELTASPDPELAVLAELLDRELIETDRAGALEAVASLHPAATPTVLAETPLPGLGRTAVDVAAELPGEGLALYSFQAEARPDGTWRIVSIQAPGLEWPTRSTTGSGLSVSAPAGETPRRR